MWLQRTITLTARGRGFHLITDEILSQLPELRTINVGVAHLFIQHTSASLALNENVEPEVRADLEAHFNVLVPENEAHYTHTDEGPDDMPAHIKAVLIGSSLTVPITDGRLNLGTWQGIYLCEHRNRARGRRVVVTVWGEGN
ncbi:MAG TPA: secondary thiamine-phosphate synthase enzyme YjbQ [Caldilineaceae bacterium]|nr:secondary thiamine-phosphate synthase enzyme YjbQ [Caldilineaceae bacterium]